jgi:hypothetical protein
LGADSREETRDNKGKDRAGNGNGAATKAKRICHFCGFHGHIEKDCNKKKTAIETHGPNPSKLEPPNYCDFCRTQFHMEEDCRKSKSAIGKYGLKAVRDYKNNG